MKTVAKELFSLFEPNTDLIVNHQRVQDVCFQKKRGLTVSEMPLSSRVHKRLRDMRARTAGLTLLLKRAFRLNRCTCRGVEAFGTCLPASVLTDICEPMSPPDRLSLSHLAPEFIRRQHPLFRTRTHLATLWTCPGLGEAHACCTALSLLHDTQ